MKKIVLWAFLLAPLLKTTAHAGSIESLEVNRTAQAINFTQSIDMSKYNCGTGMQAVYSDGTPSSHTITSGSRASATITVSGSPTALIGAQSSVTINVKSTTTISGKSVTLNGIVFTAGTDFTIGATTVATAANLTARIDAHPDWVATASGSTVTVKYALYGTSGNGLPATTTSTNNFTLSGATLSSGVNQYSFFLNGYEFKEGTNWHGASSSATIAIEISTAINADTRVNGSVSASTTSAGVVTITSLFTGISNYSISASTTGLATSVGFPGGVPSDVDIQNDLINKTSHGFTTGLRVLLATISGTAPGGLTTGTTYYAIKLNENQYALATTSTTAVAGTKIDITSITNNATTAMTPLSLSAGSAGFFWQASNDNSNFSNLSISSVTYSAAGNTLWDLGCFAYKYLRVNFTGPTSGGIGLNVRIQGRDK